MFDLTQPLTEDISCYPDDPKVRIVPIPEFAPWHVTSIACGSHSGTHMDAPKHRLADGIGIGAFGPERLLGHGYVLDATDLGENEPIPVSVLAGLPDNLAPGWFAFIRTGWDRFWKQEAYFRHPYLSSELAEKLVASGVGLIGVDALNVDSTVNDADAVHLILLGSETLIAENLCRLDQLQIGKRYAFACLPLSLGAADGSPARVVAWDPETF